MADNDSIHVNPFSDNAAIAHPTVSTEASSQEAVDGSRTGLTQISQYMTINIEPGIRLALLENELSIQTGDLSATITRYCGLIRRPNRPRLVPYRNILAATIEEKHLVLRLVQPASRQPHSKLWVQELRYSIVKSPDPLDVIEEWADRLTKYAYPQAQQFKRILVLINPYGGAGRAANIYRRSCAPIFRAVGCHVDVQTTTHQGHAAQIAESLDIKAYDVIACASGDGLPMEVFNGLGRKRNAREALHKIAVCQIPCGTGNAMSWNLNGTADPSRAALAIVKGVRAPLDLASITQGKERTLSFLSQSLGIVAETDLGTDNIRWMGDFRFTFGFLVRLLGKTTYPIDYAVHTEIEGKDAIKRHYARQIRQLQTTPTSGQNHDRHLVMSRETELDKDIESNPGLPPLQHGSILDPLPTSGWSKLLPYPNLGNFYCGNMCHMAADAPFFPAALPNDGLLDLINIDGDISRRKAVGLLLSVESGRLFDDQIVRYRKVNAVRVVPRFGREMGERKHVEMNGAENDAAASGNKQATTVRKSFFSRLLSRLIGPSNRTGLFAVDGEKLPFEPFQIEVHKGLGTVLACREGVYEYDGPRGWRDLNIDGDEA